MHVGAGCIARVFASTQMPRRFRYTLLLYSLLLATVSMYAGPARAQFPTPPKVSYLLGNNEPDPFDSAAFQMNEMEEERVYLLSPTVADAPPRRKSKKPAAPAAHPDFRFKIDQSGKAYGTFGGDAHAERDVIVKITDVTTGRVATLYADVVDYKASTGTITATGTTNPPGHIRLVSEEGTLSGDNLTYNLLQNDGVAENGTMTADTFRLHGKTIEARPDGSYIARDAMFTTCIHGSLDGSKGYPDYRTAAKEIVVYPGKFVRAKHVVFYLGRQKTIPLESLSRSLETAAPVSSVPTPSYNRTNGFTVHLVGEPESQHHSTVDYNVQVACGLRSRICHGDR